MSFLDDNPEEWKAIVQNVLHEYADLANVKNLRLKIGMSQSQFAEYTEVPVRTIQEWEQGRSTPPSYVIKMIWRIIELEKRIK